MRSEAPVALLLWLLTRAALAQDHPDPGPGSRGVGFEIGRNSVATGRLGYERGRLGFDIGREFGRGSGVPVDPRFAFVADVGFAFGAVTLDVDAQVRLETIAAEIRTRHGRLELILLGHTDTIGDPASNALLSRRRAEAVARWLTEQSGISPDAITIEGVGERAPIATEQRRDGSDDPDARRQNRRVDIFVAVRQVEAEPSDPGGR